MNMTRLWHHRDAFDTGRGSAGDTGTACGHAPPTRRANLFYGAVLVIGIPAAVAATMFVVRYLYDGVMWFMPG